MAFLEITYWCKYVIWLYEPASCTQGPTCHDKKFFWQRINFTKECGKWIGTLSYLDLIYFNIECLPIKQPWVIFKALAPVTVWTCPCTRRCIGMSHNGHKSTHSSKLQSLRHSSTQASETHRTIICKRIVEVIDPILRFITIKFCLLVEV